MRRVRARTCENGQNTCSNTVEQRVSLSLGDHQSRGAYVRVGRTAVAICNFRVYSINERSGNACFFVYTWHLCTGLCVCVYLHTFFVCIFWGSKKSAHWRQHSFYTTQEPSKIDCYGSSDSCACIWHPHTTVRWPYIHSHRIDINERANEYMKNGFGVVLVVEIAKNTLRHARLPPPELGDHNFSDF